MRAARVEVCLSGVAKLARPAADRLLFHHRAQGFEMESGTRSIPEPELYARGAFDPA
jgi:hypothetical protein